MVFYQYVSVKKTYMFLVFLMVLVFGEQNFDSRGGFKAKVIIEDATSRGGTFGGSTRTKIMKFLAQASLETCDKIRLSMCNLDGATSHFH